jgi:hypothetical protein
MGSFGKVTLYASLPGVALLILELALDPISALPPGHSVSQSLEQFNVHRPAFIFAFAIAKNPRLIV